MDAKLSFSTSNIWNMPTAITGILINENACEM